MDSCPSCAKLDSPASNGGRGLKRQHKCRKRLNRCDSPASNGGRGLKQFTIVQTTSQRTRFARQQWRAWIETPRYDPTDLQTRDSPASNGGRGLKPYTHLHHATRCTRFARQQWRAWIETNRKRQCHPDLWPIRPPAMAGVD